MDYCIPNILAERYASQSIREIWSPYGKIRLEREFWIAILKAQVSLGVNIAEGALEAYVSVKDNIDLEWIRKRESETRHDVKARLEAFNRLAGYEEIHKGLTSRDLTENVEQLQVIGSLKIIRDKVIAGLYRLSCRAQEYRSTLLTARTHNVPAQTTTLGKRLIMFGQELLLALEQLERFIQHYPIRSVSGPVGNQVDLLRLFEGNREKLDQFKTSILKHLGVPCTFIATGQVYPRSLDFAAVSHLLQVASGVSSFAKTLRLMAGQDLATEGFAEGQTGSSAMPHKVNARSCERIHGFYAILQGHLTMASSIGGDQWNEGDVSCSVVRRVVLPDAFFALDGLLETWLTVLNQMEFWVENIKKEHEYYLPFLLSTSVLMEVVKSGLGREKAHGIIKKYAIEVLRDLRSGKIEHNDLFDRLSSDKELNLSKQTLNCILEEGKRDFGDAEIQVDQFSKAVSKWLEFYPECKSIQGSPIL